MGNLHMTPAHALSCVVVKREKRYSGARYRPNSIHVPVRLRQTHHVTLLRLAAILPRPALAHRPDSTENAATVPAGTAQRNSSSTNSLLDKVQAWKQVHSARHAFEADLECQVVMRSSRSACVTWKVQFPVP